MSNKKGSDGTQNKGGHFYRQIAQPEQRGLRETRSQSVMTSEVRRSLQEVLTQICVCSNPCIGMGLHSRSAARQHSTALPGHMPCAPGTSGDAWEGQRRTAHGEREGPFICSEYLHFSGQKYHELLFQTLAKTFANWKEHAIFPKQDRQTKASPVAKASGTLRLVTKSRKTWRSRVKLRLDQTTLQACIDQLGGLPGVKTAESYSPTVRATRCRQELAQSYRLRSRQRLYAAIKDPNLRCFAVRLQLYLHFSE